MPRLSVLINGISPLADRRACAILIVGNNICDDKSNRVSDGDHPESHAAFCDVNRSLILRLAPRLILSPLIARDFDAFELASRLARIGYVGKYRAVAPNIPDKDMILRDIRANCPSVDFDVIEDLALA